MNKIIVIEGTDSSGKETQSAILAQNFFRCGYNVKTISFPDYNSPACGAVKMYLSGELGEKADDINPYQASLMFTVDRIASYLKDWKKDVDSPEGPILILDRYTSSNLIHQLSKINDDKFDDFRKNIKFIEHELCNLPTPGKVFFLKMPIEQAFELKKNRLNKSTGGEKQDIHERDVEYMKKAFNTAVKISELEGWETIECVKNNKVRSIKDISEDIFKKALNFIETKKY